MVVDFTAFIVIIVLGTWISMQVMILTSLFWGFEAISKACEDGYGSPKYIYEHSEVNWFGAVVAFLGLFLLFPVYYLLLGLYWLFHVGRKE